MYLLIIEGIQVKDAVDRGSLIDPQSPAVFFTVGTDELKTRRIRHAGLNATFSEVFDLEIDDKNYEEGKLEMEVQVINKGATGLRNFPVGKAKETLKTFIPKLNEKTTVVVELTYAGKNGPLKKGQVIFTGTVFDAEKAKEQVARPAKVMDSVAVEKLSDESKEELLVLAFGEVGELQDDFHCALQTKLITHGRLYVTNKYLCFYSKLFGTEKKVRIPFHQIKTINKGVMVMPFISIETLLSQGGSTKYTFHSFWDLEAALRTINGHFDKYRTDHPSTSAVDELLADDEDEVATPSRKRALSSVEDIGMDESAAIGSADAVDDAAQKELLKAEAAKLKYKITVLTEQPLPVSLATFISLFVEDNATHTYKAYHESVKDTNVVMSAWQGVEASNEKTRDIKFFKPVNLPGLASTRGVKLQKYKKFGEAGLLLSSSTRLEDVPAADTFSVDDTLEVTAVNAESVSVTISFQVTFIKSTFLRSMIEGPTNSEMKKWLNAFFENLKTKCQASKSSLSPKSPSRKTAEPTAAGTASPTPAAPIPEAPPAPVVASQEVVQTSGAGQGGGKLLTLLVVVLLLLQLWLLMKVGALQSQVTDLQKLLNK